jgi:hypothetical protein
MRAAIATIAALSLCGAVACSDTGSNADGAPSDASGVGGQGDGGRGGSSGASGGNGGTNGGRGGSGGAMGGNGGANGGRGGSGGAVGGSGGANGGRGGSGGASGGGGRGGAGAAGRGGGAGGGGGSTPARCPVSPPAAGGPCDGQGCFYEDCPGTGRTAASCTNGVWVVDRRPCGTVTCRSMAGELLTCAIGQVCFQTAGGAISPVMCIQNGCGTGAISCDCLQCAGTCSVSGSADSGYYVFCNTCPQGGCP